MKKLLLALGLALWPALALAQQPVWPVLAVPCQNGNPSVARCYTSVTPTNPIAKGYQQISSTTLASATKLTVPLGASEALVIATGTNGSDGSCVHWNDDGTVPTSTSGMPLAAMANPPFAYQAAALSTNLQFIQSSGATCTLDVTYYGQ